MDVRLEVVHEKTRAKQVPLRRNTIVGRGRDCQLRIPVADVSRQHCEFTLKDGAVYLRDLGSSNGTQIGGRTIPTGTDVLLSDGDEITVGPVHFILRTAEKNDTEAASGTEHFPLEDTAEFQLVDPNPDASSPIGQKEVGTDEKDSASPDDTSANALAEDLPTESIDESVIDLELSVAPAETDVEPLSDEESIQDPKPTPLKSRSLFGLFRRKPSGSTANDITGDDLMEEIGEDPPLEPELQPQANDDGSIATPQADDSFGTNLQEPNSKPAPVSETSDSVFDDDDPDVASTDLNENASDSGPDTVSFDFLDEQTDESNGKDDDLSDFLGQFGD
ncbi:MAG: FHA domain-containing protein [Planctomycetota bacterium]|nr:FHA domain-containing protein [Planctomycetota bacterium]